MEEWIPFEKGTYRVERAFLMSPGGSAVHLEDTLIEVYQDAAGRRGLKGRAFVFNTQVMALLEDADQLDLVLHVGEEFVFRMADPDLSAGKVFAPGVKSVIQFVPRCPWIPLTSQEFTDLLGRVAFL